MRTGQLVSRLSNLGYNVSRFTDKNKRKTLVIRKLFKEFKTSLIIATISEDTLYECSFRWIGFSDLKIEEKELLYKIFKEYIETPIEERINKSENHVEIESENNYSIENYKQGILVEIDETEDIETKAKLLKELEYFELGQLGEVPHNWTYSVFKSDPEYKEYLRLKAKFGK